MSDKKKSKESAFPSTQPSFGEWRVGMTLRDYFAAKAMQSTLLASMTNDCVATVLAGDGTPGYAATETAKLAYLLADAMLRERAK